MPDIPRLLTAAQLAEALGLPLETFYAQVPRLRRERGFPRPVFGRHYDSEAIAGWFARQRLEAAPFPPATPGIAPGVQGAAESPDNITAWQAELDRRVASLARAGQAA